jgi:hypothetical protein
VGYVFARGRRLWVGFHDEKGKLQQQSTGLDLGKKREAKKVLERIEARIRAGIDLGVAEQGPVTVARYVVRWTAERKTQGISSADDDATRLRLHALPMIGDLRLDELRPRHVRDLVRHLRANTKLAPRSIRHVAGALHTMLHNAVVDELIDINPAVLKRHELPKMIDRDPTWRAGAVFTRGELEQILSDERIPEDRRVMYALMGIGGLRFGEAAALRFRAWDPTMEPLGRLLVAASWSTTHRIEKSTKTEQPRAVPVHPVLAKILAAWKLGGYAIMRGGAPGPDDLVVPALRGGFRSRHHALDHFHGDLDRLGLRRRRQHDLRRTMISLARADGAAKDVLQTVTHGARGDIMDSYTTLPWANVCQEVAKLRVQLVEGTVIAMPRLAAVADGKA